MFDPLRRENIIFDILQTFVLAKIPFIIVGGYAVSAYKHRFSVDADLVIKKENKAQFEEILGKNGFKKIIVKELDHRYASEFIRYEAAEKPSASIDLLIGGLGSRTTKASFSFEQLQSHAQKRTIIGTEKEVIALVPDREVLIALKIHSGRLTDFRDIVALCKNIDLKIVQEFMAVGEPEVIRQNIQKLMALLDQKGFIDSFKGVFQEKKYEISLPEVRALRTLLEKQ